MLVNALDQLRSRQWDDFLQTLVLHPELASQPLPTDVGVPEVASGASHAGLLLHAALGPMCATGGRDGSDRRTPSSVIRALLDAHPAAASADDGSGRLPLHIASMWQAPASSVALLLEACPEAAATEVASSGALPLHLCVQSMHLADERLLSEGVLALLIEAHPAALVVSCRPMLKVSSDVMSTPAQFAATLHLPDELQRMLMPSGSPPMHRAVTLLELERFCTEHDAWDLPSWQVVRDVIRPKTMTAGQPSGAPAPSASCCWTDTLPSRTEGRKLDVFVSHAWSLPFGLLVSACRAYAESRPQARIPEDWTSWYEWKKAPAKEPDDVLFWVDLLAVHQHADNGGEQQRDLSWVPSLVASAELGMLLVLDAAEQRALKRAWCLFEITSALVGDDALGQVINIDLVKMAVLCGEMTESHTFREVGLEDKDSMLLSHIDLAAAEATVPSDLMFIHDAVQRVEDCTGGRSCPVEPGFDSVNKLVRDVISRGPQGGDGPTFEERYTTVSINDESIEAMMQQLRMQHPELNKADDR